SIILHSSCLFVDNDQVVSTSATAVACHSIENPIAVNGNIVHVAIFDGSSGDDDIVNSGAKCVADDFSGSGILYAVAGNSGGGGGDNLVIINKQTGAVQNYGTLHSQGTPIQDMEGLTFYNTTTLYGTTGYEFQGMGTANTLYRINKDNGEVTPVKQLEQNLNGYIPSDFEAVSCFPVCR
ncbi:MAG: hypothetical protein KJ985_02675, partial [Proteobacteria bacterium]|nr:hypothetical protein [Pseudomonadota bacterium]